MCCIRVHIILIILKMLLVIGQSQGDIPNGSIQGAGQNVPDIPVWLFPGKEVLCA